MYRKASRTVAAVMAAAALMLGALAFAMPAGAAARVDYTIEGGSLNSDGNTTVSMSGSGFQDVQGGFGGIYVLFGWVSDPTGDSWKPSKGGKTGQDYRYVPDDENNPTGYDVFIAFTGDPTASAANGGSLSSDGTWNAKITVPGAKFTSYDRSGNPTDVDCTTVQCGIITIGAHGVVNSTNETFTPLSFAAAKTDSADSGAAGTDAAKDGAASGTASNNPQTGAATGTTGTSTDKGTESKKTDTANGATTGSGTTESSGTSESTGTTGQDDASTARLIAEALSAQKDSATEPSLGVAGGLLVAAAIILGLALVVLAAGIGGYTAAKALLLGISPAALEREIARRERHAEDVRAREAMRNAKRKRRQAERLAREQERLDQARGYTRGDGLSSIGQFAEPEAGEGAGRQTSSAATRDSAVAPGMAASSRGPVNGRSVANAPTQVLSPVGGAVNPAGSAATHAASADAAATLPGASAAVARVNAAAETPAAATPISVSAGLRGFFDRHRPDGDGETARPAASAGADRHAGVDGRGNAGQRRITERQAQ